MARRIPPKYLFSERTVQFSNAMRDSMLDTVRKIKDDRVAVFLSSGADSNACLAAALVAGKKPTIYAATINSISSKDYIKAQATAKLYRLPFVGVNINLTETYIKKYLKYVIQHLLPTYKKNKTAIETSFIVFELLSRVEEQHAIAGFYGDAYFATLRSLRKIYLAGNYPQVLTDLAALNIHNPKKSTDIQDMLRHAYIKDRNLSITMCLPYAAPSFIKAATGMDPVVDGCQPIQKAPLRFAFYPHFEYNADNILVHSAMQKGDIKVDEVFQRVLVASDWNTRNLKSVTGIYNDLECGLL